MQTLIIKLTIWFLKRAVGDRCPDVDEYINEEGGCLTCKTYRTIDFLEYWLEL